MKHEDVLPYFAAEVLLCPQPMLLQNVALAAEEFFRRTLLWQQALDPITILPGVQTYDLDFDQGVELLKLLTAHADDEELDIVERSVGTRLNAQGRYSSNFVYIDTRQTITTGDLGSRTSLVLQAALKPTIKAKTFPDEFAQHAYDIAHGAAAITMAIQGVDWHNPQLAAYKRTQFNDRINTVTLQQAKSFSRARVRSVGFHF